MEVRLRSPLQKVEGLRRLDRLRLPTTENWVFSPRYKGGELFNALMHFKCQYGSVSIRTDSEEVRAGGSPFLFMEPDVNNALDFCIKNQDWWLIVCEPVEPEKVLVQAHVYLDEAFGRWRLAGEANEQCVKSCREAVAHGTRSTGLRDIWELEHHREYWARLRRTLLDAGLVGGEIAEVTICKNGRIVFWEV